MSGKSTVAVSQKGGSHPARAQDAGSRAAVNNADASARWAALDSHYERLVTASDAVLTDVDRKDDHRMAS